MRNELHIALMRHLDNKIQKLANDKEALDDLYTKYDIKVDETICSLNELSNILYEYGIDQDSQNKELDPSTLTHISILMKNSLDMLSLALYTKEEIGNYLYMLKSGGK
ncbi:hypothetical protein [Phocoenobacter skyensis]|uniref:Uncharacterized protein n=1 Tax=Phocoenobacter skyensis TaxID=97481 RepID=A0A1H7X4R0_9PAST|nr:hypothetical protein [Pasteurella skyensis]MDP8079579.1 hypothetical protein [Pasteurella skyensis]MDP8085528.1 hypothetical protein [Pasteurella skyensis]QLB21902.1 hypothetical protein A6B44_01235 [Pasteurella skyensis]SEM28187.1 hypothetical protein SAMN05444853_11112 [Pasteurella skyensis]